MKKPLLTPLGRLEGKTAIKFAEKNGLTLNASSFGMKAMNLSPDQARDFLAKGAKVWLDVGNDEST